MTDLNHQYGGDIGLSPSGDLAVTDPLTESTQRILRRLLTNPSTETLAPDYVWHPGYGAGVRRYIGQKADLTQIRAVMVGQMLLEPSVVRSPRPGVTLDQPSPSLLSSQINYTDTSTGQPVTLTFDASN